MARKSKNPAKLGEGYRKTGLSDAVEPPPEFEQQVEWLNIGPGGRIVIPAPIRRALGIGEGDLVQLTIEGDEIRLVSKDVAIRRVQEMVAKYVPEGVSLVDELIEERRREAEREERGE